LSIPQPANHAQCDTWMLNNLFSLRTIIKQQRQTHYMYLQMDPLDNPLSTRPFQTGREYSIELYLNGQFRFIDIPDRISGASLVPNRTRTRIDSPEPLLTLTCWTTHWKRAHYGRVGDFEQPVSEWIVRVYSLPGPPTSQWFSFDLGSLKLLVTLYPLLYANIVSDLNSNIRLYYHLLVWDHCTGVAKVTAEVV